MNRFKFGVALFGLAAAAGCGPTNWDPGYPVGLKVRFNISQNVKTTHQKWVDGAGAPSAQTSSILVGNALVSSGSSTSSGTMTIDRTWHIIGKSYDHQGTDPKDDSQHQIIYWVEGQDVINGTSSNDIVLNTSDGNGGTVSTTLHGDETTANQTVAYQFLLYGTHGDELGEDGFVYARPLTSNVPPDVNGVFTKIDPSSGQIWYQNNAIYRVIDGADVQVGKDTVYANRIEVRKVTSPEAGSNILNLCVGQQVDHQTSNTQGNATDFTSNTAVLNQGCENNFVSDRIGVTFQRQNMPVKFEGSEQVVTVRDYGYEWVECTDDRQPIGRRSSTTHPGQIACGSANRFIEYSLTELSNRNVTVTSWEEETLPTK